MCLGLVVLGVVSAQFWLFPVAVEVCSAVFLSRSLVRCCYLGVRRFFAMTRSGLADFARVTGAFLLTLVEAAFEALCDGTLFEGVASRAVDSKSTEIRHPFSSTVSDYSKATCVQRA